MIKAQLTRVVLDQSVRTTYYNTVTPIMPYSIDCQLDSYKVALTVNQIHTK